MTNEETVILIQDKIHQFTLSENKAKLNDNKQRSILKNDVNQFDITKDSFAEVHPKSVDIGPHINKFNETYETYGYLISKYFKSNLFVLHNHVEKIIEWCKSGKSADEEVLIKMIEIICVTLKKLYKKSESVQEEEIRRKNNEKIKSMEIVNNASSHSNQPILTNRIRPQTEIQPSSPKVEHQDSDLDKQLKLKLRVIINNIVSQVTTENSQHTISRMRLLGQLFSGLSVKCLGDNEHETISVRDNPKSLEFCFNVFVKAILDQAHTQLSCSRESGPVLAACIHSIMVVVMHKKTNLLPSILAEFGKHHYPVFLTNLDQYLGNKPFVNDGQVNQSVSAHLGTEAYRGSARLLGCLSVSRPAPLFPKLTQVHPQIGPGLVWATLAHIGNLLSNPDLITQQRIFAAEVVCGLLDTSGKTLLETYGIVQLKKLLKSLEVSLMNNQTSQSDNNNEEDEGGYMSALGACMKIEELMNGQMKEDGRLASDFWYK